MSGEPNTLAKAAVRLSQLTTDLATVRSLLNGPAGAKYVVQSHYVQEPNDGRYIDWSSSGMGERLGKIVARETPRILRELEAELAEELQKQASDIVGRYVTAMQSAGADPMTGEVRER